MKGTFPFCTAALGVFSYTRRQAVQQILGCTRKLSGLHISEILILIEKLSICGILKIIRYTFADRNQIQKMKIVNEHRKNINFEVYEQVDTVRKKRRYLSALSKF